MPSIKTMAFGVAAFVLTYAVALLLTWGLWTVAAWGMEVPDPNAPHYLNAAHVVAGLVGAIGGGLTLLGGALVAVLAAAAAMDHVEET